MKKERKKLTMESNKKIMLNVFSGLLLFLIACGNNSNNQNEITINQVSDTYKNNQDSIIGRPVNFYTQNKNKYTGICLLYAFTYSMFSE